MALKFPTRVQLDNTQQYCVDLLRVHGAMRVKEVLLRRYPTTRHLGTKVRTFTKCLRTLERRGLVVECDGVWVAR